MIAWKIITPKVFQAHDTLFSFIWLYRCHNFPLGLQGYLGDDIQESKSLTRLEHGALLYFTLIKWTKGRTHIALLDLVLLAFCYDL